MTTDRTARRPEPRNALTASAAPAYTPSRRALATRSLLAVEAISDPAERYEAFSRHLDRF